MPIVGMDESKRQKAEEESRVEMERLSAKLKELILSQPPEDLLGYFWAQLLMRAMLVPANDEQTGESKEFSVGGQEAARDQLSLTQLILEYTHAALSAFEGSETGKLNESVCTEIKKTAEELQAAIFNYCLFSSARAQDGIFGPKTAEIEYLAKSNWVLIRGHRYQVLEQEFFAFVLEPHDSALRQIYGVGAAEISTGIQAITDSMRVGHMRAAEQIERQMKDAQKFAMQRGLTLEHAAEDWKKENPERLAASASALADLFKGGICNLSKHTRLPTLLLKALAYKRGENTEFFAAGPLSGSPLRTLPVRIKPLVRLGDAYFATDPAFVRDSGYRAILWNLLDQNPGYRKDFEQGQKDMSETAFCRILAIQLEGAQIHREIWYKDVASGQWVENDTLIRLDDVLILVEAKAGAAATIASPAVDFDRHVRAVQDLVTKAYLQCRRFFEYLNSSGEVPLFKRESGKYVEFDRVRLKNYRVAIPIGLTVESFAPYSAMCKELPGIEPILGSHPFVSMSIDDLFVLKRFLSTTGEFLHYMEVRQSVAGIKGARLFDEMDHLGAYIAGNRFDQTLREQLSEGADVTVWDGFSDAVDRHFEGDGWETKPPAKQAFADEVARLLDALNSTRAFGWLAADSHIRNFGHEARERLAAMLRQVKPTLARRESRWFQMGDSPPLFIWLQRVGTTPDQKLIHLKVKAAAISANSTDSVAILVFVSSGGGYSQAERIVIDDSVNGGTERVEILTEADRMKARQVAFPSGGGAKDSTSGRQLPGRNEPCWCGSGKKFKKCHGATI